jgi:sigma-E factor negative regulatory protein RseB
MRGAAAVLFATCSVAAIGAEPTDWLIQASDAARRANYQGVVVYRDARMMEVLRVVHRSKGGHVQERVTSLTGRPRDILQQDDRVAYFTGDQPLEPTRAMPHGLFPVTSTATLMEAGKHYELRDLGESRVAGRPCHAVVMQSRDEFRYGYEVCADRVTAVPLRVTLLDGAGNTVEQMMFTEVAFPAQIPDGAFALPPGAKVPADEKDLDQPAGPPAWELQRLPPGFHVVMRSQRAVPGNGVVEHVLLSDGLSAVSVFGTPLDKPVSGRGGFSQMGAMNAYARSVGAFRVTVVGEVPRDTVRLIGDGFEISRPKAQAAP